jgi:hypothetical protein
VTRAHGLDSGQYTFTYVAGWASQAATGKQGMKVVIAETGAKVIATADKILAHTKPADVEARLIDAVAEDVGVSMSREPKVGVQSSEHEVWETFTPSLSAGAWEESRRPIPLERTTGAVGIGL